MEFKLWIRRIVKKESIDRWERRSLKRPENLHGRNSSSRELEEENVILR